MDHHEGGRRAVSDKKGFYIHEYLDKLERKKCPWWKRHNWGKWEPGEYDFEYNQSWSHFQGQTYTMPGYKRCCLDCPQIELVGLNNSNTS